ncbi:MAG: PAC2 family protein [Candidatus Omnitrophica bacterium]|jgi:hypothetical protein|nr:PAC2 family protein [Candidatus Omnitrophota bacterium]
MEGIIMQNKPKLTNPCLIASWPGMGEVAFKTASYLIQKLGAKEFASLDPQEFFYFTASAVKDGILDVPELPSGKFYFWNNPGRAGDIVFFLSNAQPDLAYAQKYCGRIIRMAKLLKIKTVIGMAAMPSAIDHTQTPSVHFAATHKAVAEHLKKFKINLLNQGHISGMNGLFLGLVKEAGLKGFCLLGEIPFYTIQIENPRANAAVIEALNQVLNLKIDTAALIDQGRLLEDEINKLMEFLKVSPSMDNPIGEDDIEKIKKALTQLTTLPVSVKEKIEQLFILAKSDLDKAGELKSELDKWNVYKEYEDRFLDLFKKKDPDN